MATRQILVRLEDSMVERIDELTSADGMSRAEWIRRACGRALDEPQGVAEAEVSGLREKVAGLELLVASHRDRLADSQAHALDLRNELDAAHGQQDSLNSLVDAMREQNQTLINALPPARVSGEGRGWRWWPFG